MMTTPCIRSRWRRALTAASTGAWLALAAGAASAAVDEPRATGREPPAPVRVMVVNLFGLEAEPWLAALRPDRKIVVPGLAAEYPLVQCNADAVCQLTTGMGHANAAASMMAVLFSDRFDLSRTYFVVAGIAGIDPARGTIGTVAWARYAVDSGIAHEIDVRELPRGWRDGYFGVMTDGPRQKPRFDYQTEVFQLDESLLQQALALSRTVVLEDSEELRRYRRHYPLAPARDVPRVTQCDTSSGDTWWAGRRLGEHARRWTALLTDGKGVYCTTQQEDNAVLNAMARAAHAGRVDLRRIAILRSGADFDRPYPHQGAVDSLRAQRSLHDAARIAAGNLVRAGMPLVTDIVQRWPKWQLGVPGAGDLADAAVAR
jgi:purine nucleoside permease